MKIEEVSIPSYLKENLLKEGIRELYPPQEEAIKKRVLEGENLVLATPTASGKTLVAIFATAKHLENNGKVLYLTPLRALAAEKYNEFKKYFGNKASVIATYGDYDSSDPWLSKYDIIITTNEKCLHPEEKVIVLINNELKIYKIRDLFNEFKNKCKIIKNGEKIDIVPYEKIYTLSYSFEKNEIVFSPILSIIKASGKNDMIELSFEGGKKLRCTKDHPIFILEKGKLKLIQAGESKKKYGIIFIDLSRILKKKITNINLFKLFKENNFERDFSCKISYVEYNSLVNVLIKEGKSKRRAKEKAKWYIKEGIIPMRIACKLGSKVKITHIFGLRRDSSHFIPTLITLDEKLGKLVGYYISEGSSYKSKRKFGYTYLRIATKSDWIKNDVITTCESLGIPYKIYGKNKHEIRIVSKPLYYLFTKIWKLGNNAKEKKLPDFVFFAPTSFIKGLLSALFAGDGGLSPTAIEYSTKNNLLALQLQILLTRFNVHASIYPQKVKGYRKIYWRTVIKGAKNLQRFLKNNLIEMPTLLENTEKIAFSIRGRDDMFINLPAREIISNNFKGSYRFPNFHAALYRMHRVNRKSVFAIARFLNNKEIMKVIKAPIGYIKVKSIEKERNNTQEVYNLQTTTGNYFTAEGILIHNCDSLLRHGAEWIKNISLIVVDEVHLLGDSERGPTLEMTVTKILETVPNAQVLSLSATIKNAEEIANWLKSKLINIDWRPVPLKEGVYYDGIIEFSNGDIKEINFKDFESVINIALETIMEKGQALIFTTTRRKAEKIAEKAAKVLSKTKFKSLLKEKTLQQYADKILEIGGKSSYAEKIAHVIKKGAAYHHAGLSYPYRTLIEDAFRKKYIKILAATPTLAAGVNLPARTVIIPELWRYSPEIGLYSIPVLEYKQYCGRAGRPRYDKVGYAISIARKKAEKELIFNK
ncbi:MAG: DEAD/DEAH box helicase, partial [Candidatus Aenigmatarchaeota archaeon]